MDKKANNADRVLRAAIAAVRVPGLKIQCKSSPGKDGQKLDANVTVNHGSGRVEYQAEVKRNLRPAMLGSVIQQIRARNARSLLVADHVTPTMADSLQEAGVEFIDTAGNAWLNEPPIWVWVIGQRPQETAGLKYQPTGRAFQASGLRVLFALLCKPEIVNRPYREIAGLAGVAHGTVGWVMTELPKLGYVATYRKKRILVKPERLLREWAEAYARFLRPKLLLARYSVDDIEWWQKHDATEFGFSLGGESAGARMTGYLKPSTVTLYGEGVTKELVVRFRPRKDQNGKMEIMKRFWRFDEKAALVPAPLVYADLLATGDTRCMETAEMIYEKFVNGLQQQE